jgi:formylmethanofuran dehydrogenase subunit B
MTDALAAADWTCPFCPLACDDLSWSPRDGLQGTDCAKARAAVAALGGGAAGATPRVDGAPASLDDAVAAAATLLARSLQPVIAGLGADVATARALYPLACATGAWADAIGGDALFAGVRALQDRGQFTTSMIEVRTRADVIVCLGAADGPVRHLVVLGPRPGDDAVLAAWAGERTTVEALPLQGDLFDTLAVLPGLLAGAPVPCAADGLRTLAQRLHGATYAVFVGSASMFPAQGALLIEAVHRAVGELNRRTRAAALWLGGSQGASTSNQVFTWLSGLPLRSHAGPHGLEHEPLMAATDALLADGGADAMLWLSLFDADGPPAHALPMVAIGPPAIAAAGQRAGRPTVFIPVATPGLGVGGHVFRGDGTVMVPLHAARADGLPEPAAVVGRIAAAVMALKGAAR